MSFRHIFEGRKYVEEYHTSDIERELGMDRLGLICLALLLGSDYTEGVAGIGIVNAVEVRVCLLLSSCTCCTGPICSTECASTRCTPMLPHVWAADHTTAAGRLHPAAMHRLTLCRWSEFSKRRTACSALSTGS